MLWEPWIDGFERAMRLRADAWDEIVESDDEEAAATVSLILTMNEFYCDRYDLSDAAMDEVDRTMPDMIPEHGALSERLDEIEGGEGRCAGAARLMVTGSASTMCGPSAGRSAATSRARVVLVASTSDAVGRLDCRGGFSR